MKKWKVVLTTYNPAQAAILEGLLKAQGMEVQVLQEPAARALGLYVGQMGAIRLAVPPEQVKEAQQVVNGFFRGDFESADFEKEDRDQNDSPQ